MTNQTDPKKISVTLSQALGILLPYTWHKLREQIITVLPVPVAATISDDFAVSLDNRFVVWSGWVNSEKSVDISDRLHLIGP